MLLHTIRRAFAENLKVFKCKQKQKRSCRGGRLDHSMSPFDTTGFCSCERLPAVGDVHAFCAEDTQWFPGQKTTVPTLTSQISDGRIGGRVQKVVMGRVRDCGGIMTGVTLIAGDLASPVSRHSRINSFHGGPFQS
jgi:hypothetical protein